MKSSQLPMCLTLLLLSISLSDPCRAGIIFTENFNGATPGPLHLLANTGFQVISGDVDIVGNLNGNYFTVNGESNNNAIDLAGNHPGRIKSRSSFNLLAGFTYELTFRSAVSGPFDGIPNYDNRISIGSQNYQFTDVYPTNSPVLFTARTFTFTSAVTELGAFLEFEALNSHNAGVNGSIIDDIVLNESITAVPEPSSCLMAASFILIAALRRYQVRAKNLLDIA